MRLEIVRFFLKQEELLRSKHWAWSCDSDPTNELFSWNLVMLHSVKTYQGACASKTSFAMNSDSSRVRSCKVSFTYCQEVMNYLIWRVGTINEEQISVWNALSYEPVPIILGFVKPHNFLDIPRLEDVDIFIRCESWSLTFFTSFNRTHKGNKLAWNYPIQIAIINTFVMFILLHIEGLERIPIVLDTLS